MTDNFLRLARRGTHRMVCHHWVRLCTKQRVRRCVTQYSNDLQEFNVHGSGYRNNILIYIQQDATLHSLFYLEIALHVSGGTTTYHQERKQIYLQHLVFVTSLLLSAAIVKELEPV
jgi:hypothetical protein